MGERAQQPVAPILIKAPQRALELAQRLAALRRGLGADQIREPLGRGEVELAVLESAARELARLGEAQARQVSKRLEERCDDGAAAMELELGDVLAGEALGTGEEEREAIIDDLARARIGKTPARGAPGWRHAARKARQGRSRARPRETHHGDPGSAGRAREREDRVGFHKRVASRRMRALSIAAQAAARKNVYAPSAITLANAGLQGCKIRRFPGYLPSQGRRRGMPIARLYVTASSCCSAPSWREACSSRCCSRCPVPSIPACLSAGPRSARF